MRSWDICPERRLQVCRRCLRHQPESLRGLVFPPYRRRVNNHDAWRVYPASEEFTSEGLFPSALPTSRGLRPVSYTHLTLPTNREV